MTTGVRTAQSQESFRTTMSGFQEEGFEEMQPITEDRDPRRQKREEAESVYSHRARDRSEVEGRGRSPSVVEMREEGGSGRNLGTFDEFKRSKRKKRYRKLRQNLWD